VYASVHLASPSSEDVNWLMDVYVSAIGPSSTTAGLDGFRPVICLRSDIPAAIGTTTDYML